MDGADLAVAAGGAAAVPSASAQAGLAKKIPAVDKRIATALKDAQSCDALGVGWCLVLGREPGSLALAEELQRVELPDALNAALRGGEGRRSSELWRPPTRQTSA